MIQYSEAALRILTEGERGKNSPIINEGGKCLARFDRIELKVGKTQVEVLFFWRGKEVWSMPVYSAFAVGSTLNITGIQGSMEVTVENKISEDPWS